MKRASLRRLACAGVLLLAAARDARAQVVWHGGGCGPVQGETPVAHAAEIPGSPRIDVDVDAPGEHWVATLTARYPNGEIGTRRIQASSCAQLERAVAVSLSLLDAGAVPAEASNALRLEAPAAPASVLAPEKLSEVAVPRARAAIPADSGENTLLIQRSQRDRAWFVRASALVASAGGRFAELGAALSGGLWFGDWGGRVELSARQPLSSVSAGHGISLDLRRVALAAEACQRQGAAIQWGLCAGPRLELVAGVSSGLTDPAPDVVWLPGMGAGAWLRLPLAARWALSSELQSSWSLRRTEARVLPWGVVYELPRLGASLLVGAEWAL